jgi:hypothetical protein
MGARTHKGGHKGGAAPSLLPSKHGTVPSRSNVPRRGICETQVRRRFLPFLTLATFICETLPCLSALLRRRPWAGVARGCHRCFWVRRFRQAGGRKWDRTHTCRAGSAPQLDPVSLSAVRLRSVRPFRPRVISFAFFLGILFCIQRLFCARANPLTDQLHYYVVPVRRNHLVQDIGPRPPRQTNAVSPLRIEVQCLRP